MAIVKIGTVQYSDIKAADRKYVNGGAEEISALAEKLTELNIPFSGKLDGCRSAITVGSAEYQAQANQLLNEIKAGVRNSRQYLGNTNYRYLKSPYIAEAGAEVIGAVAERLKATPHKDLPKLQKYGRIEEWKDK